MNPHIVGARIGEGKMVKLEIRLVGRLNVKLNATKEK